MNISRTLTLIALLSGVACAQTTAPLLVDADWLSTHLTDRGVVLLQVGSKTEYEAQHIPGARQISIEDVALPMHHHGGGKPGELMLELPPADVLRAKFASLGVSDDSHVIVYFASDHGLSAATRVVFTLDYLGLGDHTSVLNGGLPAWTHAGKPVTSTTTSVTPGKLTAKPTKNLIADAELVKTLNQHPGYRLVDARASAYYKGVEPTYGKNGHIPGAVNIPFNEVSDDSLMMNRDHAAQLFQTAGIKPGDTVVAYCHIGQQATVIVFAARLLGNPVLLYDGAFEDWATNNRGPVEK